jgi:ligand-binding SRPBCC domain-containing protein
VKIVFVSPIKRSVEIVKAGFTKDLFIALSPPFPPFELKRFDGCKTGHEVHIVLRPPGMTQNWVSLITEDKENDSEWYFVDEGKVLPWPLSYWRHKHRVVKVLNDECNIIDEIEYKTSPSWLGPLIYPVLWSTFAIRPSRYKKFFGV